MATGVDGSPGHSSHDCLPWKDLLEYEKNETIRYLLDAISLSLFARDKMELMEREELECSSCQTEPFTMDSLVLTGRVGYARREVVVSLVRDARLRRVRDLVSLVSFGHLVGDNMPHLMLEPLVSNAPVQCYRRWHMARCAMQVGLLQKLEERRLHTRIRLRRLLRPDTGGRSKTAGTPPLISSPQRLPDTNWPGSDSEHESNRSFHTEASLTDNEDSAHHDIPFSKPARRSIVSVLGLADATAASDDGFKELFSHKKGTASSRSGEVSHSMNDSSDREAALLALFDAGAKERRVDLNSVAATVPTVFIAWSYRSPECLVWLRENLFNDSAVRELDALNGGIPDKFAVLFGIDPWMRFVERYTKLPPRPKPDEKLQRRRVLPVTSKRAQVVLINVDKDKREALSAYTTLVAACKGWKSEEVSSLSFWAGEDGFESPFCCEFGIEQLPFVFVTAPMRRHLRDYKLVRPHVTAIVLPVEDDNGPLAVAPPPVSSVAVTTCPVDSDHAWYQHPKEKRRDLCGRVATKLTLGAHGATAAPMRFRASVENRYRILNPHATVASKAIRSDCTSSVTLKGLVSEADLEYFREELAELASMSDFHFGVNVMRASGSMRIALDPPSPNRVVKNIQRAVLCSFCRSAIDLDTAAHYRCLHCSKQEGGVLCESCAQVCMRTPPNMAADTQNLASKQRMTPSSNALSSCDVQGGGRKKLQTAFQSTPWAGGAVHPQHHILLRVPPVCAELLCAESARQLQTIPFLWGENNVRPLPLFCNRLIVNLSGQHFGVYCNGCRAVVKGMRWKCAICYQHDLCDRCAAAQRDNHSSPHHARWHPTLCVPYAVDGSADAILTPAYVEQPLAALLASGDGGDAGKGERADQM